MGSVYKAKHLSMDRMVALKFLHLGFSDAEGLERFRREAKILSTLKHKNIIGCYELGIWDDRPFVAMEYIDGQSLFDVLAERGKLSPAEAIDIARQVAEGLDCAHKHGVVHRDLKPTNILLVDGVAKIIDFGLAKLANPSGLSAMKLTETGLALGSVWYMSPEQCVGRNVDERSDIYGLGIVLYQMLTGNPPFQDESAVSVMHRHLAEVPPPISQASPDVQFPTGLDVVVSRALAKSLNERYATMEEFAQALYLVSTGEGLKVTQYVPSSGTNPFIQPRTAKKLPWMVGAAVSIAILVLAGIAGSSKLSGLLNPLQEGRQLVAKGDYAGAESFLQSADARLRLAEEQNASTLEEVCLNLGIARWLREDKSGSQQYFERAAKYGSTKKDPNDPVLVTALADFSSRFPKAETMLAIAHVIGMQKGWSEREVKMLKFVAADTYLQMAEPVNAKSILEGVSDVPIAQLKLGDAECFLHQLSKSEPHYVKAAKEADNDSVRIRARIGIPRTRLARYLPVSLNELPQASEIQALNDPNIEASYIANKSAIEHGIPMIGTPPAGAASYVGAELVEKAKKLTPEAAFDVARCLIYVPPENIIDPSKRHLIGMDDWFEYWRESAQSQTTP